MKRLILGALILTLLTVGSMVSADPPTTPDEKTSTEASRLMPGAMINNIVVPYEVMVYVETKYPGHTVTEAHEATHKGAPAYRLRVDTDTLSNERASKYLVYDKQWKLLAEEEQVAPPPPAPKPEEPAAEPVKPDSVSEDKPRPNDSRGEGDGGGNPEPTPEIPPTDDSGGSTTDG